MLSLIVAMDKNSLIGNKNNLPWYLPADLKHFKQITLGKPIIMGHKTYKSIGHPLPERLNIILSRDKSLKIKGCQLLHQISEVLILNQQYSETIVIGGAEIYQQLFPHIQRIYMTQIHAEFAGDTYFINYAVNQWQEIERQDYELDTKNPESYSFIILERK